jgi:hypothetical protein
VNEAFDTTGTGLAAPFSSAGSGESGMVEVDFTLEPTLTALSVTGNPASSANMPTA